MKKFLSALLLTFVAFSTASAQGMKETDPEYFKTADARRVGDQMLIYQRNTGGWPKNIDMARQMTAEEKAQVASEKNRINDSTTDNGATTTQMLFLARLFQATGDGQYAKAFRKGVDYLLSGQYDNGGWPQFWPKMRDYQIHITYNDDAMVNTMTLLRNIANRKTPFEGKLTTKKLRKRAMEAFNKGVECILKTQIRDANGNLTVWCQQHDRETFLPAKARAFELPSYCSQESAAIVKLLMEIPNPDDRIKNAIHAAMRWLDDHKITGMRKEIVLDENGKKIDTKLVPDAKAKPIWARYYDLKNAEPFVCDRDGIPRRHLEEIGLERRNGYSWYGDRPLDLYKRYNKWADRYDPEHKIVFDK
ncbi:MAG: pectate lyase [Prevotella sp.]|nr:pectate lyase [Prevotella sp.]